LEKILEKDKAFEKMSKRLTDKHFCFVVFLEMAPSDFANLLHTNTLTENLNFLDVRENLELYNEAKEMIVSQSFGNVIFDFDYDTEPFVFNKYIDGQLDRPYKICIFEAGEPEVSYKGKTSQFYCDKMPVFYDTEGQIIRNSLN
jgi:hypothetical protein